MPHRNIYSLQLIIKADRESDKIHVHSNPVGLLWSIRREHLLYWIETLLIDFLTQTYAHELGAGKIFFLTKRPKWREFIDVGGGILSFRQRGVRQKWLPSALAGVLLQAPRISCEWATRYRGTSLLVVQEKGFDLTKNDPWIQEHMPSDVYVPRQDLPEPLLRP